jgi:hypothetical protein
MLNFKKFLTFLVVISPFCKEDAVAENKTPLEIRQSTIGMRQKFSALAATRKGAPIFVRNALQLRAQPQARRFLAVRSPAVLVKKGLIFPNRSVLARKPVLSRVMPQRRLFNAIPGRKLFGEALFKRRSPVVPAPVPVSPPSKVPQLPPAPPTHYTVKFKDFPVGYRAHVTRQCAIRRSPPPSPDYPVIIPHNSVKGKLEQCKTLDASYPGVSQALLTVLKAQGYKE